jgi:ABC-type ATPase with predicted acetyltransferase domain
MTYKLSRQFDTEVQRSQRVLDVAEMFGLGLDDKTFVVLDGLELDVRSGDIVYITGQSGSGKSTILYELRNEMEKTGLKVCSLDEVEMLDKPIVDQVYPEESSLAKTLELFSLVGLSDANLFLRKPKELSDGQRYRFALAKMIESGAEVWMADEFLAVLDRVTAKVIAYNIQKTARKIGATLVVATTHRDMVDDLDPDLYIEKRYREKVKIELKDKE